MKIVLQSNTSKIAKRYRRMARKIPDVVQQALQDLAQTEAVPLFKNTVATWNTKPTFTPQKTARGWAVGIDPVEPYKFVDRGTRVRRAVMSADWKSKTKPNWISSRAGSGKVVFISRKIKRPGIQARNFTDIIMRRMQARAANKVREALNQASYGAGQGL